MPMKKPSSVTRANRSLRNSGCQTCGSLLNAHMPRNVVIAASRIAHSYAIGMFAGIDQVGLPEMFHVHACELQYHCSSMPPTAPEAAAEDEQRQAGPLDAHRAIDAVNREWRVRFQLGVAGVANL